MTYRPIILSGGLALALAGCAGLTAALVSFEQRAAPVVAQACTVFHNAEASPLVSLAIAGGNIASGGVAGPIVANIRAFGDEFCAAGPPVGDMTTPQEQAAWLYGVADKLLTASGVIIR